MKHKVISRATSPTTAPRRARCRSPASPAPRRMFEPLVPGALQGAEHQLLPRARARRRPRGSSAAGPPTRSRPPSIMEGPDTVAAVFLEPVQNSGGCFPPPPGYFQRVREICDQLRRAAGLRRGHLRLRPARPRCSPATSYGYEPDMITCAKGMTSGYSPIGAMIVSDRLVEPFLQGTDYFPHGYTFGGHPVSAAVALANLDIFEREGLNQHVLDNEDAFRATLEKLHRPADRRRRPRRRLLLRHRAGQGQGDQGDLQRRRVRAAAARLPVQGAVRRRPVLPGRRPRRPGHPARAAADLRPGRSSTRWSRSCARC